MKKSFYVITPKLKLIISIFFGILCLFFSPHGLTFYINQIRFDFIWSLLFPIIISLAYGPKYGFITCMFGGAFFPFYLWSNGLILTTLNVALFSTMIVYLGYSYNHYKINSTNLFFKMILFGIGYAFFKFIFLNTLYDFINGFDVLNLNFDPPKYIPKDVRLRIILKSTINIFIVIFFSELILCLPFIRNLLGLSSHKFMKLNNQIFVGAIIVSSSIWGVYIAIKYAFNAYENKDISFDIIFLLVLIIVFVFVTRVIINFIDNKLKIQELLKTQNSELQIAMKNATESDRLKSAFLANLSHEIRTPMNGILGFSNLLKQEKLNENKKALYIDTIEKSGTHLLAIINDILEISKIETKQIKATFSCVNLTTVIIEHLKVLDKKKNQKNTTFINSINIKNNFCIQTDKNKLILIISHLFQNANRFTNNGNIAITFKIQDDNQLFFSITDTGCGIPEEKINKIFDPFYQLNLNSKSVGGFGLGLSIVKAYIEALHGTFNLQSEYQKGTTFSFSIPFVECTPKKVLKKSHTLSYKYKGKKELILIAEDNRVNYLLLQQILKNNNYTYIWAKNGKEAVEYFTQNPEIKLILMDILMPEMDGYQSFKIIKQLAPKIPIIAQTAYTLNNDVEQLMKTGFTNVLIKPINKTLLLKTVKENLTKPVLNC